MKSALMFTSCIAIAPAAACNLLPPAFSPAGATILCGIGDFTLSTHPWPSPLPCHSLQHHNLTSPMASAHFSHTWDLLDLLCHLLLLILPSLSLPCLSRYLSTPVVHAPAAYININNHPQKAQWTASGPRLLDWQLFLLSPPHLLDLLNHLLLLSQPPQLAVLRRDVLNLQEHKHHTNSAG